MLNLSLSTKGANISYTLPVNLQKPSNNIRNNDIYIFAAILILLAAAATIVCLLQFRLNRPSIPGFLLRVMRININKGKIDKKKTKRSGVITETIGPYSVGDMSYIDTRIGSKQFEAKSGYYLNNKQIWRRKYSGKIISKDLQGRKEMAGMYSFLELSLRRFPRNRPFRRGPDKFKSGDYEYTDICRGDMSSFEGRETILYRGREIYRLNYRGGSVKTP